MATALTQFARLVSPDVIGCPAAVVTEAVRDAVIEFCRKSWVLRETFKKAILAASVNTALNNSVDVDIAGVRANAKPIAISAFYIDGAPFVAEYRACSVATGYVVGKSDIDSIKGSGSVYYFDFPDDDTLRLYPFDAKAMSFILEVVFVPHNDISTTEDFLYEDWKRQIADGAKALLLDMPGKTWTNHALADKCERNFQSGIAQARIQKEQKHTQGAERVRMRPYGWV